MPIFEYQCENGHITEHHIPATQTGGDQRRCSACGAESIRIISTPQRPIVKGGTPTHHGGKDG